MNDIQLWQTEYTKAGIPSSLRLEPSGAVLSFGEMLNTYGITKGSALDIGCGRGRNSFYLAKKGFSVTAIEQVAELVDSMQVTAQAEELSVTGIQHDLRLPWPVPENYYDVAVDTFCYKHQTGPGVAQHYRDELARALRPGAFYLLTLAGTGDGYYGPLLAHSPTPGRRLIIDPANGISSLLYDREQIIEDFADSFSIISYEHKTKQGIMHGKEYLRSTHVFVMCRRG